MGIFISVERDVLKVLRGRVGCRFTKQRMPKKYSGP